MIVLRSVSTGWTSIGLLFPSRMAATPAPCWNGKAGQNSFPLSLLRRFRDRGWPETDGDFAIIPTTASARQKLRVLIPEIFRFASELPDAVVLPETIAGIRESLLAAIDEAFALSDSSSAKSIHSARFLAIVQRIETVVRTNLASPIYSTELAQEVGISVRTLQDLILRYRGMSLHRYLRLKRLWLVRRHLLAGHVSVKACALAHGFWHLSDFSRSYRLQFGETPSETLGRRAN